MMVYISRYNPTPYGAHAINPHELFWASGRDFVFRFRPLVRCLLADGDISNHQDIDEVIRWIGGAFKKVLFGDIVLVEVALFSSTIDACCGSNQVRRRSVTQLFLTPHCEHAALHRLH